MAAVESGRGDLSVDCVVLWGFEIGDIVVGGFGARPDPDKAIVLHAWEVLDFDGCQFCGWHFFTLS